MVRIPVLTVFANPAIGKIFDLFRYRKKALTCPYIKQLYTRYAYIAFRENLHVCMEARLIINIL